MDLTMTLAFTLIGLAAVAAGVAGLRLPPGERIAAGLPLIVGAGVGVIALAIGANLIDTDDTLAYERVFLVASALGFAATLVSLWLLWRWTGRERHARLEGMGRDEPATAPDDRN